ncbi:hypothetical protein FOMPIDRAFT_1047858 [Fomitopsis schrenkii]|uniref:F-box domain-containing protein n=1 Tax=Fomitopsis schrenkii TaxID=2126942 RepID=S8ED01_FOMSC|nr:hypothetical protein FOMPIDRAFT_1047858 [Fomitopsis schrenkii]
MLPQLANVKRLSLHTCNLRSFSDFQRIVCAFPLLEEVHLTDVRAHTPRVLPVPPFHHSTLRSPKLTLLCIKYRVNDVFLDNLGRWIMIGSKIRTLDIRNVTMDILPASAGIAEFQIRTASTLECLRVENPSGDTFDVDLMRRLGKHSFESLVHLRTLDLTFMYFPSPEAIKRELHSKLSYLASPTLEAVCLSLGLKLPEDETQLQYLISGSDRAGYHRLHVVLTRTVFDRLARVTVILDCRTRSSDVGRTKGTVSGVLVFLRALFAPWLLRGIVTLLVDNVGGAGRYVGVVAKNGQNPLWLFDEVGRRTRNRLLTDWRKSRGLQQR